MGAPLDFAMTGLAPTMSHTLHFSIGRAPAFQLPCKAMDTLAAGLSILMAEKSKSVPMAFIQALAMAEPAGVVTLPVP